MLVTLWIFVYRVLESNTHSKWETAVYQTLKESILSLNASFQGMYDEKQLACLFQRKVSTACACQR